MNNNEGGWITVTNKKKNKRNNDKNRTFDKTKVKLWYNTSSWQHKVLINSYKYEDGTTVLDKFNLAELHDRYLLAKSNYDKNYFCKKLMRVVTEDKWKSEKSLLQDTTVKEESVPQESVSQESVPQEETKKEEDSVEQNVIEKPLVNNVESSKYKEGISYASVI